MKRINSLDDLLIGEMADLFNTENQLLEVLPKMAQASESTVLRSALLEYLEITRGHASRLRDIFNSIRQNSQKVSSEVFKGLIAEIEVVVDQTEKSPIHDTAIIHLAQRVEQYEITGYQRAYEHAVDLGYTWIMELLYETLNEERAMNFNLNELAQGMINSQAMVSGSFSQQTDQQQSPASKTKTGTFYLPKGKFGRKGIKKKVKDTDVSRFIDEGNPNI